MDQKMSLGLFIQWLFFYSTARVVRTWLFFLLFVLQLFSIPGLLRTFFSPWHRYWFGYPQAFNPKEMFLALFGNIISRVVGMILRLCVIAFGFLFEVAAFMVGLLVLAVWIVMPFLAIYFFYLGFTTVFS